MIFCRSLQCFSCFNPRAPRRARRQSWQSGNGRLRRFNPRAPRRARLAGKTEFGFSYGVSIHAPREGRDDDDYLFSADYYRFQSTRPAKGATSSRWRNQCCRGRFNPRAPRRARHVINDNTELLAEFQSTRPAKGATQDVRPWTSRPSVSIHAPREGRDKYCGYHSQPSQRFNPRAPRRARPSCQSADSASVKVSIHAPREGRDAQALAAFEYFVDVSIHAPREGRDLGYTKPTAF